MAKILFPSYQRITILLNGKRPPNKLERLAISRFIGLADDQIASIEEGINSGAILLGFQQRQSPFAETLNPILDKLANQGLTLTQLAHLSAHLPLPGASPVHQRDLSSWRHGRTNITLEKLRALVASLKRLGPHHLTNPVSAEEIGGLVSAAGFNSQQITDTTHDIIVRIDDETHIKPLLRALQSAVDTSLPADEIHRLGAQLGYTVPSVPVLFTWERDEKAHPTGQQIQSLLEFHNHFIRHKGFQPLSDEEIQKVVEVAERDYARWQALSHAEKLAERHPRPGRQPPSPTFDGMEQDR